MNVETKDCPDYETDSWEPTEPDGNCDLCVYKASVEWAMLEKEDREYMTLFMKFLNEQRNKGKGNEIAFRDNRNNRNNNHHK